jgi:putative ABC transport system substrate-binding protein
MGMRRRDFITLLGGAAAAWPLAARAQQPALPVVGYLHAGPREANATSVAGFRKGLSETGFVEGRNVAIEYRFADDDNDRLPGLAADLVRRGVAVMIATRTRAIVAAQAATATIPIVFFTGGDPVRSGFVASLNRPGGNLTGISSMNTELGAKRIGLLRALLPGATRIAVLVNPVNPLAKSQVADVRAAALAVGLQVDVLSAGTNSEIDAAFASLVQKRADGLLVTPDELFGSRRVQLATLAARRGVPALYSFRDVPEVGGLMSYGPSNAELERQAGVYAGRILKGEKPADLPVMRATKFELIVNLQTAKALGLDVPPTLLALADEVID